MNDLKGKRCQERVHTDAWHPRQCSNVAKVERDGKYYCNRHDPVKVQEQRDKRIAEWTKKFEDEQAIRKAEQAIKVAKETIVVLAYAHKHNLPKELVDALDALDEAKKYYLSL